MGMAEITWEESAAGEKGLGPNFEAFLYVESYREKKMKQQRRQKEEPLK